MEKRSLSNLDVDQLILYEADIPDTIDERKKFDFKDRKMLDGSEELSDVFKGEPPKKRYIHIAVKRPSFHTAYRELSPPLPPSIHCPVVCFQGRHSQTR